MRGRIHAACLAVLVAAAMADAAPPTLSLPSEVTGDVAAFVAVKASTDGKGVKFVALDAGLNVFPAGMLADPTATVVTAPKAGRFRLLAYTGNADGPSEPAVCVVVIGGATVPPVDPPANPPTEPPAPASLYFMVIRADGPASPEFTRIMTLPGWDAVRSAGHLVKEKTATEAKAWGYSVTPGTSLPIVLTLRTEGGRSKIAREPIPLPSTDDGVRGLPTGVK